VIRKLRAAALDWSLRHWPSLGQAWSRSLNRRYEARRRAWRNIVPIVESLDKPDTPLLSIEQIKGQK
jgi:hypothetical protein